LPPDTDNDEDQDKRVSLNPFALYPTGQFNQLNELGEIVGAPEIVTKGKASLNLNGDTCLTTFHMRGDLLQQQRTDQDIIEFESTVKLASKMATYDTNNVLTNPNAVAVRLGTNTNVTVRS
jgi:hypothetical protein